MTFCWRHGREVGMSSFQLVLTNVNSKQRPVIAYSSLHFPFLSKPVEWDTASVRAVEDILRGMDSVVILCDAVSKTTQSDTAITTGIQHLSNKNNLGCLVLTVFQFACMDLNCLYTLVINLFCNLYRIPSVIHLFRPSLSHRQISMLD